ncbi:hypothetical protein GCM10008019_46070 [Deinococcus soli (ex Cha et al. 2016)]|nr:hypothetical protein GCM10008019_46070 [Deinococcus soli (ex Cha et al. 2016)]
MFKIPRTFAVLVGIQHQQHRLEVQHPSPPDAVFDRSGLLDPFEGQSDVAAPPVEKRLNDLV